MKFTILQKELMEGLQKVAGVVPAKSPTPVLENILFEIEDKTLRLTGTDLEISVTTEVFPQSVESPGAIALPARVISEMIRSLPDIPIHFEIDDTHRMQITAGKGFYQIAGISKDNYPEIPEMTDAATVTVNNEQLSRMLAKTIFAVSSDELRPALMGVFMQIGGGEFRMVATDGHRLSKVVYAPFDYQDANLKMIIPPKAIQIALKHLDREGETRLFIDQKGLRFEFEHTTLFTRLVEGQYPDYERVIPRDNDKTLNVSKSQLIASVKRVSLFSSSLTHQIRFSLQPDKLSILSEDVDMGGQAREELDVAYNAESMEIGYNAQYMMDILKQIDTEDVVFQLKTAVNAALIMPSKEEENESFLMLIMPIKLSA